MPEIINRREFASHTGTENLYWAIFKKYPQEDIRDENLPMLLSILDKLPEKGREYLMRLYGIGRKRETYAEIAKSQGIKYVERIRMPIWRCIVKLYHHDRTIQLLYTPYFSELWHCSEMGHCPLYHPYWTEEKNECPYYEMSEIVKKLVLLEEGPCEHLKCLQERFPEVPRTDPSKQ